MDQTDGVRAEVGAAEPLFMPPGHPGSMEAWSIKKTQRFRPLHHRAPHPGGGGGSGESHGGSPPPLSSLRTAARAVAAAAETFLLVWCDVPQQNRGHPRQAHSRAARRATSRVAAALCQGWLQRYAIDEFRLSTAARACPMLWRGRQSQEAWPTRRRRGQRRLHVVCGGRRGGGMRARCARSRVRLESGAHVYVATA